MYHPFELFSTEQRKPPPSRYIFESIQSQTLHLPSFQWLQKGVHVGIPGPSFRLNLSPGELCSRSHGVFGQSTSIKSHPITVARVCERPGHLLGARTVTLGGPLTSFARFGERTRPRPRASFGVGDVSWVCVFFVLGRWHEPVGAELVFGEMIVRGGH